MRACAICKSSLECWEQGRERRRGSSNQTVEQDKECFELLAGLAKVLVFSFPTMDNLEEDLTCSVCYSLFSDPRVLPCSHTFCKTCLESVLQVSTNFWRPLRLPLKCPNCRNVVELPPMGVDALPINVSLRAIIEKYQKDYQPQPPSCPDHPRQPLNVYCVQDRQLICGLCLTIGQHHGHPIDDLQAAFIREKESPACLLARLSDERWTHVCELGEQLEQEQARCEGLVRKDRLAVDQFFHRVEVALAQKRDAYLGVLDDASTEISQVYNPLINRIKEIQEEQLELVTFGSSVEEEDSPLVFLEKVHLFRERVEAIVKAPLPSVISLSITPRAEEYLQQQWPAVTIGRLDEGPIPRVCCCAKSSPWKAIQEAEVREGLPETWSQDLWIQLQPTPAVVLLGLLLLMVALWANPIGGASLAFSLLSQFGQLVRGLSTDLTTAIWEITGLLYTEMGDAVKRWSSIFFTLGCNAYQQLTLLYNNLCLT